MGISFGFAGVGFLGNAIAPSIFGATTFGNAIGMIGFSMALGGLSTLLAPEDKTKDDKENYLSSGPRSTTREGSIVPIPYGRVMVGGALISGGIHIEDKW